MPTLEPEQLEGWARRVLESVDATDEIADLVARSLVSADLRGHSSHGVRMLPMYLDRIGTDEQNRIDPTARPHIEAHDGPRVLLDGADAFGRVVGHDATEIATATAREYGIALVGIRDGNHLGRMGEWAERAAAEGLVSLTFVKGEAAMVAPPGTAARRLSTNPIAAGVPTFDALPFPIVLDMATSAVAGGKVWERHSTGAEVPEGWLVADDGDTLQDAEAFVEGEGALFPLGGTVAGHKGFGLAVVAELLGAVVGNGVVAGERGHVHFNNAVAMFAVDPTWFSPASTIADRVRTFAEYVREAPLQSDDHAGADAGTGVLLPGEPEHLAERANRRTGIDLPPETVADLNDCAMSVGCEPVWS